MITNKPRMVFGGRKRSHYGYSWWKAVHEGEICLVGRLSDDPKGVHVPGWVNPETKSMLPTDLLWPDDEIAHAHALVDALLSIDVETLLHAQESYPDHTFGFEERYLPWALAQVYPDDPELAARSKELFPEERQIKTRDLLRVVDVAPRVRMTFHVVRLKDGDSWGQVIFATGKSILTKAWIDLISNHAHVYVHHRGRWKGIGVNPRLVERVLGKGVLPTPAS
jgi:hypothetical protein